MTVVFKIKVVKVGNSLRVTIPQPLAEAHDLHAGDTVAMQDAESEIKFKKAKS